MLIERLQGLRSFYAPNAPKTVLDLGCGSAILALVAKLLWPHSTVVGIDNDPLALENANDNLAINQLDALPLICGTLDDAPAALPSSPNSRWDLIIANLYCSLLLELEPQLASQCERLILSGVMESEATSLLAGFKRWETISTKIEAGWFSAELVRPR
jgi:ribosomal protein L11 methyltransferase